MNITFLGQGAMGSRMADRLVAAGYQVHRWNRTGMSTTPREAAQDADIVIAMLRDDGAAHSVWLDAQTGALGGMRQGALAIECSTLSPAGMTELHMAAMDAGVGMIDAPVLGSRPQAEAGQLIHLIGGDAKYVVAAQPLLVSMSAAQHHVGPAGAGTALKLIANTLFGAQVALLAELLGRMKGLGLDPAAAVELLSQTPVLSPSAKGAGALMLARRDEPLFPVELVAKDFGYTIGAEAATMPVTNAAADVFATALQAGLGAANLTAVARIYEN